MTTMTDKQVAKDAFTIANYMTLASIENEIHEVEDVIARGEAYDSIHDVLRVLKEAEQLLQ
jgi:hypothetical protein